MLYQYLWLLTIHWFGDFVVQTHWQASNKSKRFDALSKHVLTYTLTLAFGTGVIFSNNVMACMLFVITNGILHFITDFFTSRLSSKLYAKQEWHNFFVIIGLDQLIHQVTIALTMIYFFS